MSSAAADAKRVLPKKEQGLFRDMTVRLQSTSRPQRFYEQKTYKKSLKIADEILRKVPEHAGVWCA
jgi:hypothetical protein